MRIKITWKWFDLWIGVYIDRDSKAVYICLVPTIVIKIWRKPIEFIAKGMEETWVDEEGNFHYHNDPQGGWQ